MAIIVLSPAEVFEHRHDESSRTILLSGSATLDNGDGPVALVAGVARDTPGGDRHAVTNTGADAAVFECYHSPEMPDPDHA